MSRDTKHFHMMCTTKNTQANNKKHMRICYKGLLP